MLKVALTGGIGSGKSTVTQLFEELGTPVIDADIIAHQLVEKGKPALKQIQKTFGNEIIQPDGSLNRQKLREQVFSNETQKKKLESILHPLIYLRISTLLDKLNNNYCIISIPLLFETQMTDFVDRIVVIDCPLATQIERVKKRDQLTEDRIMSIIDSQVSREYRKARANDIIENGSTLSNLAVQVKKLHNLYNSLSVK